MKLLLTSNGLTNKTIEAQFFRLVGKPAEEIRLAFIPTAMNMAKDIDKRYAIRDLHKFDELKIGTIDIVDISALPQEIWQPRLSNADVLYVEGGNSPHLLNWMKKSGLAELMPDLLKSIVYVGRSAGSIVMGKRVTAASSTKFDQIEGLGLVNFSTRPHYNNKNFLELSEESMRNVVSESRCSVYAIDDNSALVVEDERIEVISEGRWKKFEK